MLASADPAVLVLDGFRLSVLNVGLACCAVEAMVAALGDEGRVPYAGTGTPVDVLLVSGTVTAKLAPLVQQLHAATPGCRVVAFGACASSGGPYWDSYCVTAGVDQLVPVDLYVPGCPPRPQALLDALATLAGAREGQASTAPLVRPAVEVGPQELRAHRL